VDNAVIVRADDNDVGGVVALRMGEVVVIHCRKPSPKLFQQVFFVSMLFGYQYRTIQFVYKPLLVGQAGQVLSHLDAVFV
jgi:hypothetical protein